MAARNLSLAQPTLLTSLLRAAVVLSKAPSSVVAEEKTERKAPTAAIADASSPPALGEWKQWRGPSRVKAAYGGNYQRLVEVKRKYDPMNFFHINKNISPET